MQFGENRKKIIELNNSTLKTEHHQLSTTNYQLSFKSLPSFSLGKWHSCFDKYHHEVCNQNAIRRC